MIRHAALALLHYSMRALLVAGLVVSTIAPPTYAMETTEQPISSSEVAPQSTETTPVDDGVVLDEEESAPAAEMLTDEPAAVVEAPEVTPEVVEVAEGAQVIESGSSGDVGVANPSAQEAPADPEAPSEAISTPPQKPLKITEVLMNGACTAHGVDCTGNAVEYVEIYNPNQDAVRLDEYSVRYSRNGATAEAIPFTTRELDGKDVGLVGKNIPEKIPAANGVSGFVYLKSIGGFSGKMDLANAGGRIELVHIKDGTVDAVAWGDQTTPKTTVKSGVALQRCGNIVGGEIEVSDSFVSYDAEPATMGSILMCPSTDTNVPGGGSDDTETTPTPEAPINYCDGLRLTEIGANLTEQFIEVQNSSDRELEVTGCRVMTNRSTTKYHSLPNMTLAAGGYVSISVADTPLALTKTTKGTVYLLDSAGIAVFDEQSYANLSKDTSWSLVDGEWRQTYTPTPGAKNNYQQYVTCEAGYERNEETGFCRKVVVTTKIDCKSGQYRSEETGRCRNIPVESMLAACKAGQYRSPETGRCRNVATVASALTPCKEGQYRSPETNRCRNVATTGSALTACKTGQERNPATNRCRAIASATSTLKPCAPGQERNSETNRCRKVVSGDGDAGFAVVDEPGAEAGTQWSWLALGGLGSVAIGYAIWEWRREIAGFVAKLVGSLPFVK